MKLIYLIIFIFLTTLPPLSLIFTLPILLVIFISLNRKNKAKKAIEENKRQLEMIEFGVKKLAIEYETVLARKRQQLYGMKDEYGDLDNSNWEKEVQKFIKLKVVDSMPDVMERLGENHIYAVVDDIASQVERMQHTTLEFNENMDGIDYEHYCADILRNYGWEAIVSKASNDFGADIIAKMNGITVAIQCKRYSKPIGISAVQEVVTGQQYYDADHAAVVTNNSFTLSARMTAKKTNVVLVHHDELSILADKFGIAANLKSSILNKRDHPDGADIKLKAAIQVEAINSHGFQAQKTSWYSVDYSPLLWLSTPNGLSMLSNWDVFIRLILGVFSFGFSEILLFIWRRISKNQTHAKHAFLAFMFTYLIILQSSFMSDQSLDSKSISEEEVQLNIDNVANKISILQAELRQIPAEQYEDNLQRYKTLMELSPSNALYKDKTAYYQFMVNTSKLVSHLKPPYRKQAFDINVELRGIPSTEIQKNINLYQQLYQLDPDNPYYRAKLATYNSIKQ